MIAKHIIVIGGFTQHMGVRTGCSELWDKLRVHQTPATQVWIQSWYDDFDHLAEMIWRCRPQEKQGKFGDHCPEVVAIGYSFGGYSAVVLARHLAVRGVTVKDMVLCDPVYRHWYRAGWWRSMVPWSTIRVPWNVKRVRWLRQKNPRFGFRGGNRWNPANYFHPAGHDLVAEDTRLTTVNDPVLLKRGHRYMDDAPEFHAMSMEAAA